jgi:hypothetical protein
VAGVGARSIDAHLTEPVGPLAHGLSGRLRVGDGLAVADTSQMAVFRAFQAEGSSAGWGQYCQVAML